MLSGTGTIDYSVEAHTLDAQETSAACQESTTKNLQQKVKNIARLARSLDYVLLFPGFALSSSDSSADWVTPVGLGLWILVVGCGSTSVNLQ